MTLSDKLWAFQRMKYAQTDRENALIKTPLKELQKLCVNNVDRLERLADQLEAMQGGAGGLMAQRDALLENQM